MDRAQHRRPSERGGNQDASQPSNKTSTNTININLNTTRFSVTHSAGSELQISLSAPVTALPGPAQASTPVPKKPKPASETTHHEATMEDSTSASWHAADQEQGEGAHGDVRWDFDPSSSSSDSSDWLSARKRAKKTSGEENTQAGDAKSLWESSQTVHEKLEIVRDTFNAASGMMSTHLQAIRDWMETVDTRLDEIDTRLGTLNTKLSTLAMEQTQAGGDQSSSSSSSEETQVRW